MPSSSPGTFSSESSSICFKEKFSAHSIQEEVEVRFGGFCDAAVLLQAHLPLVMDNDYILDDNNDHDHYLVFMYYNDADDNDNHLTITLDDDHDDDDDDDNHLTIILAAAVVLVAKSPVREVRRELRLVVQLGGDHYHASWAS